MLLSNKNFAKALLGIALAAIVGYAVYTNYNMSTNSVDLARETDNPDAMGVEMMSEVSSGDPSENLLPIQIEYLQNRDYPGSELTIEQTLSSGSNYSRHIASYDSDGLKQYGLLTIPNGEAPEDGWPAIIFNHGYISPEVYRTTERYNSYTDYFSRNGYIVYKPDYRGHDQSEGQARGGYGSSDYIIDVLNAVSSVETLDEVNPDRIGMWGHSMGGWITHRSMVVDDNIDVGVIWAGMVGGYDDLIELREPYWVRQGRPSPTTNPDNPRRRWRSYLVEEFGSPSDNREFWDSISAIPYLDELSGPIQLHHATGDESVPAILSEKFYEELEKVSPESELYIYQGDNHNISVNFNTAMERSLDYFDEYLK